MCHAAGLNLRRNRHSRASNGLPDRAPKARNDQNEINDNEMKMVKEHERAMSKARHQRDVANVAIFHFFQFVKEDPLQFAEDQKRFARRISRYFPCDFTRFPPISMTFQDLPRLTRPGVHQRLLAHQRDQDDRSGRATLVRLNQLWTGLVSESENNPVQSWFQMVFFCTWFSCWICINFAVLHGIQRAEFRITRLVSGLVFPDLHQRFCWFSSSEAF